MKITKQRLKEIIKEEVKQSGLFEKRGFFKKLFGKPSPRATGVLNMIHNHIDTFPHESKNLRHYEEWNEEYLKLRAKLGASDPNKEQSALGSEYNKIYIQSMDIIRDINAKNWDRRKAKAASDAIRSKERELEKFLADYEKSQPSAADQAAYAARKREDDATRKRQQRSRNQEKSWDDPDRRY